MIDKNRAPYAPLASVRKILEAIRVGNEGPWTAEACASSGVTDSMIPRTLNSLEALGIVDAPGNLTGAGRALLGTSEPEYAASLKSIVREAYAEVLARVDPSTASAEAIALAFAGLEPRAQQDKMVSLFRGLSAECGLSSARRRRTPARETRGAAARELSGGVSPIEAVLRQLPTGRRWTKERRDAWITAMTSFVDLLYEIDADAERGNAM